MSALVTIKSEAERQKVDASMSEFPERWVGTIVKVRKCYDSGGWNALEVFVTSVIAVGGLEPEAKAYLRTPLGDATTDQHAAVRSKRLILVAVDPKVLDGSR